MRNRSCGFLYVLMGLLAFSVACNQPQSEGAAQVVAAMPQSISAADVTDVRVTVSAADMPALTMPLVRTGGQWEGVLGNLPAGTGRTFRAEAFNASGAMLYAGETTGVTVVAGQTTVVSLLLQEITSAPGFENAAPYITSLVATSSTVEPGGTVTLQATASDDDAGDALTYAWSAGAGGFSSTTQPSTIWTAPSTTGPVTITLKVTDSHAAQATVSLILTVGATPGSARVNVAFNTWPRVTGVVASPSTVDVGESTTVTVSAVDGDGDSLNYAWGASCQGNWANASSASATFTPSTAPASGTRTSCALTVTVRDGRGGQATGTLHVGVGPRPTAFFPPKVVDAFQSTATTTANGTVTFRVRAWDPQGRPLSFSWTAGSGTLSPAASAADSSEVSWTAPSCAAANPTISATVTNTLGLSSSHSFQVAGLPGCATFAWLQVKANDYHTVALRADGTVWAWGNNSFNQLGDGTSTPRSTPVQVQGLSGIKALSASRYHTVALAADGTVWAWGSNTNGQLGDGTTLRRSTPVQVQGLAGIKAISAADNGTVALKEDGTVWTWGSNSNGQLGDGTTSDRLTPVQVQNLSGVTAIAAGESYVMALKQGGTVWGWGWNYFGQLGDGTSIDRWAPVQVQNLSGVMSIHAAYNHTVALKGDGTLWAWGYNFYGQLGDGTRTHRQSPVQMVGLSGVTSFAIASGYTAALKADGTVWTWGNNAEGQLGDGTTTERYAPAQVQSISDVVTLSASRGHMVVEKRDGTLWAWGMNPSGQLGDGTTHNSHAPVKVQVPAN